MTAVVFPMSDLLSRRSLRAAKGLLEWPQAVGVRANRVSTGDRVDDIDWRDCQACLAGQSDAGARLFKRHEPEMARQMWRFSRQRAVCEELVHEVFVEAFVSLPRYRPHQVPFIHWLRRIATRVGYRHWKREARRRQHQSLEGFDKPVHDTPPNEAAAAAVAH